MELIIVTGMSGAGKSQAASALEDAGFYCVDNIPPKLLPELISIGGKGEAPSGRLAVVMDIRSRELFSDFYAAVERLKALKVDFHILFLDAEDDVLLHRYQETRRRHPLMASDGDTLEGSIALERRLMQPIRELADRVLDTSRTTSHQLREMVAAAYGGDAGMSVTCLSFGFKYGLPPDADVIFDLRCLPNPFYVPELKALTGRDKAVSDYLWGFGETRELFERIIGGLEMTLPLYLREGKNRLTVGFGCTGGQHRSVAFAEACAARLKADGFRAAVLHRETK